MYYLRKQNWSTYPTKTDPEPDKYGNIHFWEHLEIPGLFKTRKRGTNVVIFVYGNKKFRKYSEFVAFYSATEGVNDRT